MLDVARVQFLCPLCDGLLVEHGSQIMGDLDACRVSRGTAEFGQDGGVGQVGDAGLVGEEGDHCDDVVVEGGADVGLRAVPESGTHGEGGEGLL